MEVSPEEQMEVDVRESEEEDIAQIEPPEENLPCILHIVLSAETILVLIAKKQEKSSRKAKVTSKPTKRNSEYVWTAIL